MVDKKKYKSNIGAATAYELCKQGFHVHMISRTEDNLKVVQQWVIENFPEAKINYSASSVGDRESIFKIVEMIPKEKTIFWVQSVGLGGGTVKIKDDNPYLAIEDISSELMEAELSVLTDTVKFLQVLLPRFRTQKETKVCIVSSMSAIRSVAYGSIHNAAKGSISRFTNAAMIELNKDKIYVTDVRPGAIDTGMYDSKVVQEAVQKIASSMNYDWSDQNGGLRLAPPSSVGKLIAGILSSEAHITSINMVAKGQFPHEGS
jgi:short-subunit dehydrogenase